MILSTIGSERTFIRTKSVREFAHQKFQHRRLATSLTRYHEAIEAPLQPLLTPCETCSQVPPQ